MLKPASTSPGAAPELGADHGHENPATPAPSPESGNQSTGIDPQEFKQLVENQKVMFAALKALGNQQFEPEPEEQAPAVQPFQFPEVEGYEALAPVMNQVLGPIQTQLHAALAENKRLQAKLDAGRLQDNWGFFKNSTADWEKYNGPMGEICETLGIEPQNAEQFRYIYELAKAKHELPAVMADAAAARRGGPVPSLKPASPSLRSKLSKQLPERGLAFGAGGFRENLAKVRLGSGGA